MFSCHSFYLLCEREEYRIFSYPKHLFKLSVGNEKEHMFVFIPKKMIFDNLTE